MNAITTSVAKEVENATSVGNNQAHSNGGSRKNKYSREKSEIGTRDRAAKKGPLYYGHR